MARVTEQERSSARDAVVIDTGIIPMTDDADSEQSWDEWQEGLKNSDETGTVRAYKLPVDGEGNPTAAKGRQVLLGTWAHQLYTLDQLCDKVKSDFMNPGETAHIRFQGNQTGRRGVMFNKIVTLQKARGDLVATHSSEIGTVVKAMQDSQAQMSATLERLLTKAPEEKKDWLETTGKLMAILTPLVAPVLTHLLTRQPPKSDLEQLMGTMLKMKEFMNGDGGGEESDSMTSMIKAIAPGALQVMATLAARQPMPGHPQQVRRVVAKPVSQTVPNVPPHNVAPVTPAEVDPMLAQLKPQLDQLADLAEQGADPAEVAKLVLDTMPENSEFDSMLYDYLSDKSKFSRLFILSPKFGTQKEWGEKLRVALLAEFEQPDGVTVAQPAIA